MRVAEAVGRALAAEGVGACFGVLGSGNLVVTNALRDAGVPFYAARHEAGAMAMADGYARASGRLAACSVHQGPGLTNAITALTEAAKSRTPLLLLAADTPAGARQSNFRIAQDALVEAVGAVAERVDKPGTALADVARAARRAREERRAVVLMLPLDVQAGELPGGDAARLGPGQGAGTAPGTVLAGAGAAGGSGTAPGRAVADAGAAGRSGTPPGRAVADAGAAPGGGRWLAPRPAAGAVAAIAGLLAGAERPAIVAGRGAVLADAGPALRALGERCGAILATSAVANGLFRGDPFDVGIAGGFSSPVAARLLAQSDVVVAFGAALNQWTTRHGTLIAEGARVAQVDLDAAAIGAHRPVDAGAIGDAAATAEALLDAVAPSAGRRSDALAAEIAAGGWHRVPFTPRDGALDPRALTIALDALLPEQRTVVVDSGHFMGWPSMYLRVPDPAGFVFPQAFQCVGLGLGCAIGAALARPDRLTVAALGDGGAFMALPELETLARLRLPLLVVVYDDEAYGAEVHHFRPLGHAVDLAQFPPSDLAALARAAGCGGVTVRTVPDLDGIRGWLAAPDGPLLVDAKVDPDLCADWLEEAFRDH